MTIRPFFSLLQVGDTVTAHVDYERRAYIAANHTMTHQVNQALRATLVGNGKVYLFICLIVLLFCDYFYVPCCASWTADVRVLLR